MTAEFISPMKSIVLFLFLSLTITSSAQNKFGGFNVSLGATQSMWRWVHKVPFKEYDTNWKFTVGSQLNVDLGILRRFSIGGGLIYHIHHLNIENYSYNLNGQTIQESPTQTIIAFGGYYRALIHMKSVYEDSDEQLDLYWGFGQQFMSYRTLNNSKDPNFYTDQEAPPNYYYAVAGIRYYPTEWFGVHGELAIPGPYTISLGATFRFGGTDELF